MLLLCQLIHWKKWRASKLLFSNTRQQKQNQSIPLGLMHRVPDCGVTGGAPVVPPRVTRQGGHLYQHTGHWGDSVAVLPVPQSWEIESPRAEQGGRCEPHTECCDLEAGGIRTVYWHHRQSLAFVPPEITRHSKEFLSLSKEMIYYCWGPLCKRKKNLP